MYHSRYTFEKDNIAIALDALSGELLEFRDTQSGENFIKNSMFTKAQPLVLTRKDGKRLFPLQTERIVRDPSLRCEITSSEGEVCVHYSYLTDGEEVIPADVTYTVVLEGKKTYWRLHIAESGDYSTVRFPCVNGVYLGKTWEDDTLYYPMRAGREYHNPVDYFSRPLRQIEWRWQEYRYRYNMGSCSGKKDGDGMYGLHMLYPGELSMSYLDYVDEKSGLYFASHGKTPSLVSLGAVTPGPENPCMCFFAEWKLDVEQKGAWSTDDVVLAAHGGDWHEGAEIYRAYKEPLLDAGFAAPEWFTKGAGMLAHYDFKYQNGGIVHTYRDIPAIKAQAKRFGLDHVMFAGWHQDGFDNGFPQYYPDPDLGTEEELYRGCTEEGEIRTSCYINSRIVNAKYKDVSDRVVINADGTPAVESYGNKDIAFACMCPSSAGWQKELLDTLIRVQEKYGMRGVYLDQLSTKARYCYSREHGHTVNDWCYGYKAILKALADRNLALMGEEVSDEFGPYVTHFAQSFYALKDGSFPEMYRYTFPKHRVMDVLYPSKNLAMRPVFVEQNSDYLMQIAFVDGMYFWIYDLEEDNTFERDEEQMRKLKSVIALRKLWLSKYDGGIFRDTVPLFDLPEGCHIRCYEMAEGFLLAIANNSKKEASVCLRSAAVSSAVAHTPGDLQGADVKVEAAEGGVRVAIPADEYSIIRLV